MISLGLCSTPAAAVEADAAQSASPCELHVWPGPELKSVYHGWFHGGIVNGAVDGRDGYPEVPADPIGTADQVALLGDVQPQHLLMLEDYRLVVHDEALSSRVIRNTPGRIQTSTSTCYAELIVEDVFLQQDAVNGSALKMLIRYRSFGDDPMPRRSFGTWVQTPLSRFPPKKPEDVQAALADIRTAFKADLRRFAEKLLAPPKRKD